MDSTQVVNIQYAYQLRDGPYISSAHNLCSTNATRSESRVRFSTADRPSGYVSSCIQYVRQRV